MTVSPQLKCRFCNEFVTVEVDESECSPVGSWAHCCALHLVLGRFFDDLLDAGQSPKNHIASSSLMCPGIDVQLDRFEIA